MRLTVPQILKRAGQAKAKKENWRSIYEDCYRYALPQRNLYDGYYEGGVAGQSKMKNVFDSTAIHATQRFANRIQSGLFPPYKKWCRLEPGTEIPAEQKPEVQVALDAYLDKLFTFIRQSNFDLAMGEFLLDLSVGTACMLVQAGDDVNPIRFTAIPQYLVDIEEGPYGTIDNVYRYLKVKVENIEREFPESKLNTPLKSLLESKPTEQVELCEATIFDPEIGDYCYHVISKKFNHELLYKRLVSTPWVVSRYMKVAGEVHGRGPLVSAIPDIKTLNKTLELLLKNASLAIAGVYTAADDGVLNPQTIRIVPGAVIPVSRNGGPQGASLAPLPRAGDFNVSQIIINDLRMNIKKIMLDDSLPPDNMSARSATEIVERMKELAQNLGSAFGRLIAETMVPLVKKTLEIMDKKGYINLPLKVNGLEVRIVPVSPIAKAQNLEEINEIMQYYQIAQGLGPAGIASVKPEAIADLIADKLGITTDIRNTPEERQMIEEAGRQMAEQQMMLAQAQGGGGGSPPPEPPAAEAPEAAMENEMRA
jgi:hypothetical protein